jgi:hypothetical protein
MRRSESAATVEARQLPRTISNTEDVRQLMRASGSVALADEAREQTLTFSSIILNSG